MGFFDRFKKQKQITVTAYKDEDALLKAYNNTAIIGEKRHTVNQSIIKEYKESDNPLDILAVAISLEREGAAFRRQSITYFERFLSNSVPIPFVPDTYLSDRNPKPMFSYWYIYSTLATLYEKEYDFSNAIKYLQKLPKESDYNNSADYTRQGDVLAKIDINEAIRYYEQLKTTAAYKKHKNAIDYAYADALKKKEKGYKYRTRKRKE